MHIVCIFQAIVSILIQFQFEPIITPGNEKYVHHIVFQKCNGSHPDLDGKMAVCAGEERDKSVHWPQCQSFGVWAYGGEVSK